MLKTIFLLFGILLVAQGWKEYLNAMVIRVQVKTPEQMDFLLDLENNNVTLDFWIQPRLHGHADIRMDKSEYAILKKEFDVRGMEYNIFIENVGEIIKNQLIESNSSSPSVFALNQYNSFADIRSYLLELRTKYPHLVTLTTIGYSYQGRELIVVRLTSGTGNKPGLFFDGGIHAREWISPATVLYILNTLVTTYDSNPEIKAIVNALTIYVLPVFNPDGYEYSRTTDRLWRKSRSPNTGSNCVGTDLNRNWAYRWGGVGASADPCSETYRGSAADSQIETSTISKFIVHEDYNIKGYINFHSYSQLWLGPWGFTTQNPAHRADQDRISSAVVEAIYNVHGTIYDFGPSSQVLYATSGSSVDFTYDKKIVYSFTIELRDTGRYGFTLPANQIIPSGEETIEGWKVFAKHIIAEYSQ